MGDGWVLLEKVSHPFSGTCSFNAMPSGTHFHYVIFAYICILMDVWLGEKEWVNCFWTCKAVNAATQYFSWMNDKQAEPNSSQLYLAILSYISYLELHLEPLLQWVYLQHIEP